MEFEKLFKQLWINYSNQNPSAGKIHNLFTQHGEIVENDHIAFRTFDDARVNIQKMAKPFLKIGYEPRGDYHFEEKKLHAVHFENSNIQNAPRIFISELKLKELSNQLQQTVNGLIAQIHSNEFEDEELVLKGVLWETPSYKIYEELRTESEYAAWLYVYGFRTNHFTVSVNSLNKFNTIEKVNEFIKQNGFLLNSSGGEIKGTPEMLLQQSSIMADIIDVEFKEGVYQIPACYYEFALRYKDRDGKLFSGFHSKSADKIFESTNFYKK